MKYKLPKNFSLDGIKDAHELKDYLKKVFPDAFINWYAQAFSVGDTIERNVNGTIQKYQIVKTHDNKSALLNVKTSTLWKNFSTENVGVFNSVSIKDFMEISNGMKPNSFKKSKK